MPIAAKEIKKLAIHASTMRKIIQENQNKPHEKKTIDTRYRITRTASIIGKSERAIRDAENSGRLPPPLLDENSNQRLGYTPQDIQNMRSIFNQTPKRNPQEDEPIIIAIQNFKGGVGKSTKSVLIAQYFAMAGYSTLLVDCDPQASATSQFGIRPDKDIESDQTLYSFISGEQPNLKYAPMNTYWPNLKIIPSNLMLYGAEFMLFGRSKDASKNGRQINHWLRDGLNEIKSDYDVIIIDPPPSLGLISLNVLYAANACIIPLPPEMLDYYSTEQYIQTLDEVFDAVQEDTNYHFLKILISRKKNLYVPKEDRKKDSAQDDITDGLRAAFGSYLLNNIFYESAEIQRASAMGRTLYELSGPAGRSSNTYKRAIQSIDMVCQEIEHLIQSSWPSYQRRAKKLA